MTHLRALAPFVPAFLRSRVAWSRVAWSRVAWSRVAWSRVARSRVAWSRIARSRVARSRVACSRVASSLVLWASLAGSAGAQEPATTGNPEARLLRFPHIQGDRIAFVHGGDIWTASANGGTARRVTSFDDGLELFPRISPDGRWIAFSGEYTGSRQVYLVAYEGGTPRQLTAYPDVGPMPPRGGYDHLPIDWTPDGKRILVRANRTPYGQRISRYFLVDPWHGGLARPLQIPEGGPASLSPDGNSLAYNIISREWRTWKRYCAGRAQDVFLYNLENDTIQRITDFAGTDNFPMWLGDRVYFTSDRSGTLNLHAYDLASKKTRQVTGFQDFDVLFPSRGRGGLIFEAGGYLHVMDQGTEKVRRLRITLADDRPWLRPAWRDGSRSFAAFSPSPSGKRVLVEYRGEIFSAPKQKGEVRNLTRTPGRRERAPAWSPDGTTVTWLAESGNDYELFAQDVRTGEERQLTRDTGAWITSYQWSPDSKRIAFTDKHNRLMVLDVKGGGLTRIDVGDEGGVGSVSFSADGAWLTYVKQSPNTFTSVWIAAVQDPKPIQVSGDWHRDHSPAFDPKGRYLYFVSARDYKHDGFEFENRIYALLLRKDVAHPLAPESDEEVVAAEAAAGKEAAGKAVEGSGKDDKAAARKEVVRKEAPDKEAPDKEAPHKGTRDTQIEDVTPGGSKEEGATMTRRAAALVIDTEGLADRLVALPMKPGRYAALVGLADGLLYASGTSLHHFDLKQRKHAQVLEGMQGFVLTPDHKQLFYRHQQNLCAAVPKPGQKAGAHQLPLAGVRVRVVPQQEWQQMYTDAWRIMRDWFYDPGMHAVDWPAMREKYMPLVAHCSHRTDLDFLLGELIGELNCGHTYVAEGETPRVKRVPVGLLGCEFEQVGNAYRIGSILPGENWHERTRNPLREAGVDVKEGDFLVAIDGQEVAPPKTPYHYLENTVGRHVTLLVNDKPGRDGARKVVVKPVASERGLRYLAWVQNNRRIVDKLSEGRIGYIHVPNTAIDGHRELFEGFRPQARVKQALIIDDRYNGGGWIPDRMAMELGQPVLNYWARRSAELSTTPRFAFEGPKAMLINGYSSSGGDAFPYYFRKLGLGKLIGKKTWGGLVGYSGSPRLADGGGLAVPSFAFVNTEGQWDVEAVGVAPDIEVFDDPTLIQAGREPILEAAVKHLLEELDKRTPPQRPVVPKGPKRNR